jgi:hypothetical protein
MDSSALSPGAIMRRFSIRSLMAFIIIAAIGLAAIRSGSAAGAGVMFSITFFAMIAAFLGIALGRGMRRVFWLGFATLGWSYLLLMYVPWLYGQAGRFLLAPNLFATLEETLQTQSQGSSGLQSIPIGVLAGSAAGGGFGGEPVIPAGPDELSDFVRIGVAIEALLWAFLGGWSACYFASGGHGAIGSGATGETATPQAQR